MSWHPAGDRLPDKTAETVNITSRLRPPTASHQLRGSPGQVLIPRPSSLRLEHDSAPDNSLELREFRNLPAADHHHRVRGDLGVHQVATVQEGEGTGHLINIVALFLSTIVRKVVQNS